MMSSESAIGLFDSGIGGLTVLQKIIEVLPKENTIYLGDTARANPLKRYFVIRLKIVNSWSKGTSNWSL
jgi:hypothetical protein